MPSEFQVLDCRAASLVEALCRDPEPQSGKREFLLPTILTRAVRANEPRPTEEDAAGILRARHAGAGRTARKTSDGFDLTHRSERISHRPVVPSPSKQLDGDCVVTARANFALLVKLKIKGFSKG